MRIVASVLTAFLIGTTAAVAQDYQAGWKHIVDLAIQSSSYQNNGSPRFGRVCQPELKVCTTSVMFKNNEGLDVMVRAASDMNDRPIKWDVCTFNVAGDIRTCQLYGSAAKTKEMKDIQGNWLMVGKQN